MQLDIDLDRKLFAAMVDGRYDVWRNLALAQVEESGEQELLNWCALLGAMDTTDQRCVWACKVETHVFNSTNVAMIFAHGLIWRVSGAPTQAMLAISISVRCSRINCHTIGQGAPPHPTCQWIDRLVFSGVAGELRWELTGGQRRPTAGRP